MEICRLQLRAYIYDVGRGYAAHEDVGMLMELNPSSWFCNSVTDVFVCRNRVRRYLAGGAPIEQGKVSNVNVTCPLGRSLGVNHEKGARVIDVQFRG